MSSQARAKVFSFLIMPEIIVIAPLAQKVIAQTYSPITMRRNR